MKDVKTLLPYFITLIVGFMIAWFIQQSNGGTCDCDRLQETIERLQDAQRETIGLNSNS